MPELSPWLFPSLGVVFGLVAHGLFRLAFPERQPALVRVVTPRRRSRGPTRRR